MVPVPSALIRDPRPLILAAALLCAWALASNAGGRGDPWPLVGAAVLALTFNLIGRALPRRTGLWAGLAVGSGALGAVLLAPGSLSDPSAGPLGYANANAALVVQGAAAFAVVGRSGPRWLRLPSGLAVIACFLVCLRIQAVAATAGCALVLAVMIAAGSPTRRRAAVALTAFVGVTASLGPFAVGAGLLDDRAGQVLSERRVHLWQDGVEALSENLILGVGTRDFPTVSPAATDEDTREAHAEFLQRAVENGLPGLTLEAAAVLAVAAGLIRRATPPAACACAGWTALWVNAGVDWVLSFPAVLGVGALVSGLGYSEQWGSRIRTARRRPSAATIDAGPEPTPC